MPSAAPKPCSRCGVLVRDGTGRCASHPLPAWGKAVAAPKRITGRRLQRMRAELFQREPMCRECMAHGRLSEAVIRDHIKPLAEGGQDVDANVQPLCLACSDAKTATESARGVARAFGRAPATHPPGGGQKSGTPSAETVRSTPFMRAQVAGEGGVDRWAQYRERS